MKQNFSVENKTLIYDINSNKLDNKLINYQDEESNSIIEEKEKMKQNVINIKRIKILVKFLDNFKAGTIGGSIVTLYIGVVGAGILSLPLSFYKSGYVQSIIVFIIGIIYTYISCVWLIIAAQKTSSNSYMQIAQATCNKYIVYFIKINYLINNWGYTLAFAVIINRLTARCVKEMLINQSVPYFLVDEQGIFYSAIMIMCVAFPLSIKKQLTGLSYLGILSCFISLYTTTLIIVTSQSKTYNDGNNLKQMISFDSKGLWLTLPTAIFAFTCQQNVLDFKQELIKTEDTNDKTELKSLKIIFIITFSLAAVIYILVGFFGYYTFSKDAKNYLDNNQGGIIFLGYTDFNAYIIFGCLITVVSLTFTMVFCYKPAKDCFFDLIQPGQDYQKLPQKQVVICIFIMCFLTILFTFVTKTLNVVIIFLGALQGPLICFILPGYFYYKLHKEELKFYQKLLIFLFFGLFQVVIMVLGVKDYLDNPN